MDAAAALTRVAETKAGDEAISSLASDWLDVPSPRWTGAQKPQIHASKVPLSDFDCSHLMKLWELSGKTENAMDRPFESMQEASRWTQDAAPAHSVNARSRALKVLATMPELAEKRSRKLVPYLLSWTAEGDVPSDLDGAGEGRAEELENSHPSGWSMVDRKALLGVFAQFTNPRVLYQNQRVYDALLVYMTNGDVEIQRLALKAILAWKQEGIKTYKENLEGLLDDTKFRGELTALFQGEHSIQPQHRPELMPVLLRLLYGRTISKKGAASGRQGLHATRLSVIRSLSVDDVGGFLQIALGRVRNVRPRRQFDGTGVHLCTRDRSCPHPGRIAQHAGNRSSTNLAQALRHTWNQSSMRFSTA